MNDDALDTSRPMSTTTTTTTVAAPVPAEDVPPTGRQASRRVTRVGVVPDPTYLKEQNRVVIPVVNGVDYVVGEDVVTGSLQVDGALTVEAKVREGYEGPEGYKNSWTFGS